MVQLKATRAALAALFFVLALLEACGGGGSVTGGRVAIRLPPFASYSTDLGDVTSVTPAWSVNCIFGGVFPGCNTPAPPTYSWQQSNAVATTSDPFRWRAVVNLEDTWGAGCNTGPPNQSLALAAPITWKPDADGRAVQLGFELADSSALCSKIPYVAAAYVPQPYLLEWGRQPQLVIFTRIDRSSDLPSHVRHIHFWVHLRDRATGKRWMAHRILWSSWAFTPDFAYPWNWPIEQSYYFAGMGNGPYLHGGASGCDDSVRSAEGAGQTEWTIDLEGLAVCRFPELAVVERPDIAGIEFAVEGTYLRSGKSARRLNFGVPFGGALKDLAADLDQPNRIVATFADLGLTAAAR